MTSYTVKDASDAVKTIESAVLRSDSKTVVLTLAAGSELSNQTEYSLSVRNVRGSVSATANVAASDIKFTPIDSVLPTVVSVEGLGNKAVKVTFSEPVIANSTVAANFKIDDAVVSGILSGNGTREVVIEVFNTLATGDHTLTIGNLIEDYAGFDLISTSKAFTVVADTEAPVIAQAKDVTLEGATLVFNEEIKTPAAEVASNYYWMNGTTKHTAATAKKLDGKTVKLTFTGDHKLPAVATDLFVINVSDYSGNVVAANTKVAINAVVDQTRPEVVTENFDGTNVLTLTFNKAVDPTTYKTTNVVLKGSDGKVVTKYGVVPTWTNGNTVLTLTFSSALDAGTYTVELTGLRDTTVLANTLLPYSTTVTAVDQSTPTALAVTGTGNVYYVTFDKAMDTSTAASVTSTENYYVTYVQNGTTKVGKLPVGTNIVPINGNKGVIITLPTSVTSVSSITIQGVKSATGKNLANYAQTFAGAQIGTNFSFVRAYATDSKTVYVKLNQPVSSVISYSGITVGGSTVTNAVVDTNDNTLVKLTLSTPLDANATGNIAINAGAFRNLAGSPSDALSPAVAVLDAIAPEVVKDVNGKIVISTTAGSGIVTSSSVRQLTVNFNEGITVKNGSKLNENFHVYRANGLALEYGVDFTATPGADNVVLAFTSNAYAGDLQVWFDNSNGNVVDASAFNADGSTNSGLTVGSFDTRDGNTVGTANIINLSTASVALTPASPTAATDFDVAITAAKSINGSNLAGTHKVTIKAVGTSPAVPEVTLYDADATFTAGAATIADLEIATAGTYTLTVTIAGVTSTITLASVTVQP